MRDGVAEMLARVSKLLYQAQKSKGKIYALHEPEVDCISKGKARVRYEFGCKVSVATTIDGGFVVGMRAMPGNSYDGHTLAEALEQVETLTDQRPNLAVVDRGYRGHEVRGTQVLISGMRRGMTQGLWAQPQSTAQRDRAGDRPHEIRWPPGAMPAQGHHRRCDLRRTLRLRTQHPQDPGPAQASLGPASRLDRCRRKTLSQGQRQRAPLRNGRVGVIQTRLK
ncbi:Mobile element protein [Salipiger mucosus DSM 16094]|uniref:Mobile element protein n=1 Tax=Salipiger mucosus DSM 16094 TaxID=1123237 RepID=S9QVQ6_9RHOB|nr:Mobile element protein [Salipiger mucosus DSM 16094]